MKSTLMLIGLSLNDSKGDKVQILEKKHENKMRVCLSVLGKNLYLNDLFNYPITQSIHYKFENTYLILIVCNAYISGEWYAKQAYEFFITTYSWKSLRVRDLSHHAFS